LRDTGQFKAKTGRNEDLCTERVFNPMFIRAMQWDIRSWGWTKCRFVGTSINDLFDNVLVTLVPTVE
jgi:hypothetical protein